MKELAMVRTVALKRELEQRGCDTSSVKPAKKTWTVGFKKTLYQYMDDIEADTEEQAISIARSRISEGDWSDYNNGIEVSDCNES